MCCEVSAKKVPFAELNRDTRCWLPAYKHLSALQQLAGGRASGQDTNVKQVLDLS